MAAAEHCAPPSPPEGPELAGLGLRGIVAMVPPLQGSVLALDDNEFSSRPLHLSQKRQAEGG